MQKGVRLAVPLFNEIYQVGKKDKDEGMSREQAQKRANYLYSDEFLDGFKLQAIFAGKSYNNVASWFTFIAVAAGTLDEAQIGQNPRPFDG